MSDTDTQTRKTTFALSENSEELLKNSQKNKRPHHNIEKINFYLLTSITTMFIYVAFAAINGAKFSDVMLIQLPLGVIISLIMTYLTLNDHILVSFTVFSAITALIYGLLSPDIAFIILVAILSQAMVITVDGIYTNENDYMIGYRPPTARTWRHHFTKAFSRMKYHLLLAVLLLIFGIIFAYFYPATFQNILIQSIQGMQDGGTSALTTKGLFINNSSVAMLMIECSVLFAIPTLYLLFYNGLVIGFVGMHISLGQFMAYTLPHGIFELTAIVIAGAISFRIAQAVLEVLNAIVNSKVKFKESVKTGVDMILDCFIPIILVFVLLIIAAFIEANLTIPIGQFVLSV